MAEKYSDKKFMLIAIDHKKNKDKNKKPATDTNKSHVTGCIINDKTTQETNTEKNQGQTNTQTTQPNTKQLDTTNGELDNFTPQTTTNTTPIATITNRYELQTDLNEQINANPDKHNNTEITTENKQPANEKK